MPSRSLSRLVGLSPTFTSSPSLSPSLSESALRGFVPALYSARFLSPSRSASLVRQVPFRWFFFAHLATEAFGAGFFAEAVAGTLAATSARTLRRRTMVRIAGVSPGRAQVAAGGAPHRALARGR